MSKKHGLTPRVIRSMEARATFRSPKSPPLVGQQSDHTKAAKHGILTWHSSGRTPMQDFLSHQALVNSVFKQRKRRVLYQRPS